MTGINDDPEKLQKRAKLALELCKEDVMERARAQQSFSEEALKALLLVNGGAMVALFTLVGAIGSKGVPLHLVPSRIWVSFFAFTGGLFVTLLTYLLAFLSQAGAYTAAMLDFGNKLRMATGGEPEFDVNKEVKRTGRIWIAAICVAVLSAVLFVVGAGFALSGFLPH